MPTRRLNSGPRRERRWQRWIALTTCAGALLVSAPGAHADGGATGVAAALGLTAATGKTTLSANAGQTEATLLVAGGVMQAGEIIRSTVDSTLPRLSSPPGQLLIIGRADTLDFASATALQLRLLDLNNEATDTFANHCTKPSVKVPKSKGDEKGKMLAAPAPAAVKPVPADITAALATDVTIAPISLSLDDRMLISAVASAPPCVPNSASSPAVCAKGPAISVPGEIMGTSQNNRILIAYTTLQHRQDQLTKCQSDEAKALVTTINAFKTSVAVGDKSTPSPLSVAAKLAQFPPEQTWVLRVALEQVGGTGITRSNIWYTLGWPGAARVSAGLLASYRLTNIVTGEIGTSGMVVCAIAPVSFDDVQARVLKSDADKAPVCRVIPTG